VGTGGTRYPKDVSYEMIRDPNDAGYGRNKVTGMSIRGRMRDTKNVSYAGSIEGTTRTSVIVDAMVYTEGNSFS
jgi:hypothetical protein